MFLGFFLFKWNQVKEILQEKKKCCWVKNKPWQDIFCVCVFVILIWPQEAEVHHNTIR